MSAMPTMEHMSPSPREFESLSGFLNSVLEYRKGKNHRYSLRRWSQSLGYKSPSFLAAIMKGERRPNIKFIEKLVNDLSLEGEEGDHFKKLAIDGIRDPVERADLWRRLQAPGQPNCREIDEDSFRFIKHWFHLVILACFKLKGFKVTPRNLTKKLRYLDSQETSMLALSRLERLNLIQRKGRGFLLSDTTSLFLKSQNHSQAVRDHHREFGELALRAIEDQPTDMRDLRGSIVTIHRKDYEEAQKIIEACHSELLRLGEKSRDSRGASDIYRLNTQFFSLTR